MKMSTPFEDDKDSVKMPTPFEDAKDSVKMPTPFEDAKVACGPGGTVHAFSTAIALAITTFNPIGADAFAMFAVLSFLSSNVSVLEYILGEDKFLWPAQLTRIEEEHLYEAADFARMAEYKAWIEEELKKVFRSIARNPYTEEARAYLIRVLQDNECWRTFAARKAADSCNLDMLKDVLVVIGNGKIIQVREHGALYNSILSTILALPESEDKKDMHLLVRDMFNVKRELPLRLLSRRSLKRLGK